MSKQVNIYEAKTRLSQLVDEAGEGEEIVIARNGRPAARLVPLQRDARRPPPGAWKRKGWIEPDFDETPKEVIDLFSDSEIEP
jgi:prevent-host-death family protein